MASFEYLIVGGGMAGHAVARGIRERDRGAGIGLLSAEAHRPYKRPPLSKGLWRGEARDGIWLEEVPGLEVMIGRAAVHIDRARQQVVDDLGRTHSYGTLALATGGAPRRLPASSSRVIYFRSLDDFDALHALPRGGRVAVVGGGFIGTELAAALATQGHAVILMFPESRLGGRRWPAALAEGLTAYYREHGVEVQPGTRVSGVVDDGARLRVSWDQGTLTVDAVVAGLGITPNIELARVAGLAVDDGILVDANLRTSDSAIFAVGDVAQFPSQLAGRHIRVEHEDNALTMGLTAGQAMTGAEAVYRHEPFFYSDLFDLGYEAVGDIDARMEVVADWKVPLREGVLYYLQNGRVRGVATWGIFGQMEAARALLAEPGPHDAKSVVGRLAAGTA